MKVEESYELPFESEFDWRVTMFQLMQEYFREALIEVVNTYKESDEDFEWKDDERALEFVQENKLFDMANELAKQKVEQWFKDNHS